jgi:TolB protein
MNADGSGQTRLTNEPANDDSPSWSPLGLTILFRSDRERDCCDPTAQIWSMNADGTNQLNLSNDGSNESSASLRIDASSSASQAVNTTLGWTRRF